MSDLSERYGKCPDCGAYAVHLATREVIEFSGDQDDNLDETSIYEDGHLELKYGVTLFVHACFECGYLEDVGIEWPREKVIDTRRYQWTPEWPTAPGLYWFHGWAFLAKPTSKPEMLFVEMFISGNDRPVYVSGASFMYKSENNGLWSPANLPEPPIDQLEGAI